MDVDATTVTECLLVSGSSFCFAAAAAAAETDLAEMGMTAACGSSCFSSAAADAAETDLAETDAAANPADRAYDEP